MNPAVCVRLQFPGRQEAAQCSSSPPTVKHGGRAGLHCARSRRG
ncbi:Hypothetical protein AA314_05930 [Archangium gephyra]|uniref:Uncharacterized protein n=1 Tax=Archangium gephyra TaxID=48 RepID=A0AAC8QBH6_9BACT|nr:Hypothetical protein AA314_05930 [Archangium gephyra]